MQVSCGLTYGKVRGDQDTEAHLVVSLKAPLMEGQTRPRLALVLCIDISSSMAGDRLDRAKQSALKIIDHLRPDDYFGVVAFGSTVQVVAVPALLGSRKAEMQKEISALQANGMTNLSGGMLKSLSLLQALDLGGDVIHRVVMLTDGQANVGPEKTPTGIIQLLTANRAHVTCSAFGYGSGSDFSPDFLTEFAREGKGNYAHIESPDGALKAFGTELGGLMSTYATDIRLEITPTNGHVIDHVLSDVSVNEEPTGEVYVEIPDLLAEEVRHIVCSVKLTKQTKSPGPRAVNVFDVKATFLTFDSLGKRETHVVETKAKVQFVKDGDQDTKPDESIDQIVGLAQLIRSQLEAEVLAKRGSFQAAKKVLEDQSDNFTRRGRHRLASASVNLAGRMGTQGVYSENLSYLQSFANGGTRGLGVSAYAGGADHDLADLGVATYTSSTTATSNAFAGGAVPPSGGVVPVASVLNPGAPVNHSSPGGPSWDLSQSPPPVSEQDETNRRKGKDGRLPLRQIRKSTW